MNNIFLTFDELVDLTGWHIKKKQIEQLRIMGLPFFVNGQGRPVVPRSYIGGNQKIDVMEQEWIPELAH